VRAAPATEAQFPPRHFHQLKRTDLDDFVECYFGQVSQSDGGVSPQNENQSRDGSATLSRHNRIETDRFKTFTYDELTKRDKVNLDIFWLKDDALEESANLPAPETIAT
jgi:type I restriction enzyme M protein